MDLLRLVLSHQPLQRLLQLHNLLGDIRFRSIRARFVNTRSSDASTASTYIRDCVAEGELIKEATKYVPLDELVYRSMFLHDVEMYFQLAKNAPLNDVYMALKTGVPEIQAFALALGLSRSSVLKLNCTETDLTEIEWTPDLRRIFKDVILPIVSPLDSAIFGYLEIDIGTIAEDQIAAFEYFRGYSLKILGGEGFQSCKHQELETVFEKVYGFTIEGTPNKFRADLFSNCLVKGGYTYPLFARTAQEDFPISNILKNAIIHARYNVLISFSQSVTPQSYLRNVYGRVPRRRIDEAVSALEGYLQFRLIVNQYKVITGRPTINFNENHYLVMMARVYVPSYLDVTLSRFAVDMIYYLESQSCEQGYETPKIVSMELYRLGKGSKMKIAQNEGHPENVSETLEKYYRDFLEILRK